MKNQILECPIPWPVVQKPPMWQWPLYSILHFLLFLLFFLWPNTQWTRFPTRWSCHHPGMKLPFPLPAVLHSYFQADVSGFALSLIRTRSEISIVMGIIPICTIAFFPRNSLTIPVWWLFFIFTAEPGWISPCTSTYLESNFFFTFSLTGFSFRLNKSACI